MGDYEVAGVKVLRQRQSTEINYSIKIKIMTEMN